MKTDFVKSYPEEYALDLLNSSAREKRNYISTLFEKGVYYNQRQETESYPICEQTLLGIEIANLLVNRPNWLSLRREITSTWVSSPIYR